ncbi:Hachiman antiphage defense system protein HamA [Uniformispora flossi]|uniref:Hachiman antiphage defense system protein HamA n=1 Tax=Uniformispora flossi TaxID=3390723 RepID=UPI003C2CBEA9
MASLQAWVRSTDEQVGSHLLRHMVATQDGVEVGVHWAAEAVPGAYVSPKRVADILESLGKPAAATFLKSRLPTGRKARSGDLGEIIGAQIVTSELGYPTVSRLRWKDHREMAMRGDDIIGVRLPDSGAVQFLKGEAKSIASLDMRTVEDADRALQGDDGRPSPHALQFVAERLHEQGDDALGRAVDAALLVHGITEQQVVQLLFTFTGGNPCNLLRTNTKAYSGAIRRFVVGLQVRGHQEFVAAVYDKVVADA